MAYKPKKRIQIDRTMFDGVGVPTSVGQLYKDWSNCTRCSLCKGRKNVVIGDGSYEARVMAIGQWPGRGEDKLGVPFSGQEGQNTRMWITRSVPHPDIYWTNILSCMVPEIRGYGSQLKRHHVEACQPRLSGTIQIIKPCLIIAIGTHAARALLQTSVTMQVIRGVEHSFKGHKLVVILHPAGLSRQRRAGAPYQALRELEAQIQEDIDFVGYVYQSLKQ